MYVVKVLPEMPHLVANDPQLSPETTWIVLQSPRRVRLLPLRFERQTVAVALVAVPLRVVALDASTSGVLKLAVLVTCCADLNVRHVALAHDRTDCCTGVKDALLVAIKPKMWSPS